MARGQMVAAAVAAVAAGLAVAAAGRAVGAELPLSAGGEPTLRVQFRETLGEAALLARGYDAEEGVRGVVDVFVSEAELAQLAAAGVPFEVVEKAQPLAVKFPTGYTSPEAVFELMNATAARFPAIAQLVDVTETTGSPPTYEGRHIYAVKISDNVGVDEDEPNLLFVSTQHAREPITTEAALDLIVRLTEGYETDAEIRAFVDTQEIFVAPVWNPDGYDYAYNVNNMWRKTREPSPDGAAVGTDLNRNYDYAWDGACGGSTLPSSETYRGTAPASAAETQTMVAFSLARNFAKKTDLHSSGREVLAPQVRCSPFPTNMGDYGTNMGIELAELANYDVRPPSADAGHIQWTIKTTTLYAYLLELGLVFQPPYEQALEEVERIWPLVKAWLGREAPLTGRVTNLRGVAVEAEVVVREIEWQMDESWSSRGPYGRYYAFLPDGTYTIDFVAAGYATQTQSVTIDNNMSQTLDVVLTPGL